MTDAVEKCSRVNAELPLPTSVVENTELGDVLKAIAANPASEFFLRTRYIVGQGWVDSKDSTSVVYTNWGTPYFTDANIYFGAMPAASFASATNLWNPITAGWTQQVFCQRRIT